MNEIDAQTQYHNHKETIAWTAIGLYLPGIIALGFFAKDTICYKPCWLTGLATFIILIFLVLVLFFVNKQFDFQNIAAKRVEAFEKLINDCAANKLDISKLQSDEFTIKDKNIYPEFIQKEIESKTNIGRSFATILLTDIVSNVAIILATIISLLIVWFW
jgi:hypothetical protein